MIVRLVQIISEYIGVILCLHTFAKVKKEVNIYNFFFCILNIVIWIYIDKGTPNSTLLNIVIYLMLLLYIKMCLEKKWLKTIKLWGIMMVMMPSLQLGIYFVIKMLLKASLSAMTVSVMTNILICMIFWVWNEKFFSAVISFLRRRLGVLLVAIFVMSILYLFVLYKVDQFVQPEAILQIVGGIWAVILFLVIFLTVENERKIKEKELRLYQVYNKSFEDAILTIRQRQHEFDNHINAIRCMQYSIDNSNELREVQDKYCDLVLKENSLNRLLKTSIDPIIIGVLYSKLAAAQNENIEISQVVHAIDFRRRIEIVELIEIMGILIDNAVEALQDDISVKKKLSVQMISEEKEHFYIEVANTSRYLQNSEIEKFFKNGYSTKGERRGMGLPRLLSIIKKNKAEVSMRNITYEGQNFFSVKVSI